MPLACHLYLYEGATSINSWRPFFVSAVVAPPLGTGCEWRPALRENLKHTVEGGS